MTLELITDKIYKYKQPRFHFCIKQHIINSCESLNQCFVTEQFEVVNLVSASS